MYMQVFTSEPRSPSFGGEKMCVAGNGALSAPGRANGLLHGRRRERTGPFLASPRIQPMVLLQGGEEENKTLWQKLRRHRQTRYSRVARTLMEEWQEYNLSITVVFRFIVHTEE